MPTRVMVLEDHPMMRETIEARLVSHSEDIEIAYCGASMVAALAEATRDLVDCVVLDLDLGDGSTFTENLSALAAHEIPIVIISANATPKVVQAALSRGVKAYVSKQASPDEFLQAVDAALRGAAYVSTDLAAMLAKQPNGVTLSAQEQRALVLYSSGMKLEAVARKMDVSPGTVKEYIKRVRAKYAAIGTPLPTKMELYRVAREEGLV